ncbi:DUF501 domain-containing protein [Candidatus Litorirhabdus singularis]|uniref:DUF501 domain-containing protein n=1 Tax=Candidatus Litorirhabdus singularis TaxID=2518993 RepID=UPI00243258AD|nr:DUF501 domain-containing protein [Candidatus Litorirhabdus singularis]
MNTNVPLLSVDPDVSIADSELVAELLGRSPRGLKSIAIRADNGSPVVIQVSSLVDEKPFPTLFWLVDKQLNYAIDRMEAGGFITLCQARVDASTTLQQELAAQHQAYIDLRHSLTSPEEQNTLENLGFSAPLQQRGIGGIQNFSRIRCLHTYYAAHLVVPNKVGDMVDDYWLAEGISFSHLV